MEAKPDRGSGNRRWRTGYPHRRETGKTITHSELKQMQPHRNAMDTDARGAGQSLANFNLAA